MRRRLIVACAVGATLVLAAGLVTWRLNSTGAGGGPVTVGACRVPVGPLAIVASARRNSPAPKLDGVLRSIVDLEVAHRAQARSLTVVQVDGGGPDFTSLNLALERNRWLAVRNVRRMIEEQRATDPEADVLTALRTGADEVRRAGLPATVVLQDSGLSTAGPLDFRHPPVGIASDRLPDLRGITVVLDGIGDVAPPQPALPDRSEFRGFWAETVRDAGAACVVLTGARRSGEAPTGDLPPVTVVPQP